MFPEEFPIEENKEQKEMFLILQKDYIDGFISPTISQKNKNLNGVYITVVSLILLLLFHSLISVVFLVH